MDFLLSEYNKNKRNCHRIISTNCIIRKRGDLLHICLNSPGCRFRKSGSCTMCDYGQGSQLTEQEIEPVLLEIKKAAVGMRSILIGTLGSVLDPTELSMECLEMICEEINHIPSKTIIFETHYSFIDEGICQWLRQHLPEKDIVIEVGLESADKFVQEKCLNKKIDIDLLKSKIDLLHVYGMSVTANTFLGAPFLSVAEQIDDAEKTINWAINNGVDSVVVFPANIRKYTLLDELYKNGKYFLVQQWEIFELLCRIPSFFLNRIYLAWYGDWIDIDENGECSNHPPYACKKCEGKWMEFYHEFLFEKDNSKRELLLQTHRKELSSGCGCRDQFEKSMNLKMPESRECRLERAKRWIEDQLYINK